MELQIQYDMFKKESEAISSQIDFMEESVVLAEIKNRCNGYTRNIIPQFSSIEEAQKQLDLLVEKLQNSVKDLKDDLKNKNYKEIPDKYKNIDVRSEQGEFLEYILECISEGETDSNEIAEKINQQLDTLCIIHGENIEGEYFENLYDNPEEVLEEIAVCFDLHNNKIIFDMEENIEILEHHIKLFRWIDVKNSINIYRQAFIQLIAMFDTVVFECFRIKFRKDFFDWLQYFKDGNIKYSEMAKYQNFENFKKNIIDEKLKNCYLKDLLIIARNRNKDLFVIKGIDHYVDFRETINRRNCHIHNNGIVDNAYLGLNNSTKEEFNVYGVNIGDYLSIDKSYFNEALLRCKDFILKFSKNVPVPDSAAEPGRII